MSWAKTLLAFAGIGDPSKFFRTLARGGCLASARPDRFPTIIRYTDEELDDLVNMAEKNGLTLITTAKDHVRLLDGGTAAKEFAARTLVLEIELAFSHPQTASRIIRDTRDRARTRAIKRS